MSATDWSGRKVPLPRIEPSYYVQLERRCIETLDDSSKWLWAFRLRYVHLMTLDQIGREIRIKDKGTVKRGIDRVRSAMQRIEAEDSKGCAREPKDNG